MQSESNKIMQALRIATGIAEETDSEEKSDFDTELSLFFSSVSGELEQVGIVDPNFTTLTNNTTWRDWLGEEMNENAIFQLASSYTLMRVKLLFDPPLPATISYMSNLLDGMLQRLRIAGDSLPRNEAGDIENE